MTVKKAGHFPILGLTPGERKENITEVEETLIDTTKLAWDFMSKHEKSSEPNLQKNAKTELIPSSVILLIVSLLAPIVEFFDSAKSFLGGFFGG